MRPRFGFFKATIIGGVIFLIPFVLIVAIAREAFAIMRKVANPISSWVPIDSIGDIAIVNVIAIGLIILVCFIVGLASRTVPARKLLHFLESRVLSYVPFYAFVKGMTAGVADVEDRKSMKPVLVRFDDYSQVGFEIEHVDGGSVAVYLPGAPNPWSGSICLVTEDRIQPLDVAMMQVVQSIVHLGRGSGNLLRDALQSG